MSIENPSVELSAAAWMETPLGQYLLERERAYIETEMRELGEHSPFRQVPDEQD